MGPFSSLRFAKLMIATVAAVAAAGSAASARPAPPPPPVWTSVMGDSGVCPNILGDVQQWGSGGSTGNTSDCNLLITFNADGSVTMAVPVGGASGNYDGNDDALIGIVNNSGQVINTLTLSGSGSGSQKQIFGFENDGISTYLYASSTAWTAVNGVDTTGYAGPTTSFRDINQAGTTGTVVFANGLATGTSTFFSLEQSISIVTAPTILPVDEPGSALVLGGGLLALALAGRTRLKSGSRQAA